MSAQRVLHVGDKPYVAASRRAGIVVASLVLIVAFGADVARHDALAWSKLAAPAWAGLERRQMSDSINQERLTIRGSRLTKGGAVECPKVRADDGAVYSVSYLAPTIAIGDRIEVVGFMANITTCLGPVLYAEEVRALGK